jgi:hypothetical protein
VSTRPAPANTKTRVAASNGSNSVVCYLHALFRDAQRETYIELRCRTANGMDCTFWPVEDLARVARKIVRSARQTDVYIGVLPRLCRAGTRDNLVDAGRVLWADCDTPASVRASRQFSPPPSIVVASGTQTNRHAYWLLHDPASLDDIERANRALAHRLGADERCSDAARVLRPPSLNHKHAPPRAVRLLGYDAGRTSHLEELVDLADLSLDHRPRGNRAQRREHDPLLQLDPAVYVTQLTGIAVGADRKISCPFHDDRTPSLHVYREGHRGWYCFGCGRGGTIYDFGAAVWRTSTRGEDFVALRARLRAALGR